MTTQSLAPQHRRLIVEPFPGRVAPEAAAVIFSRGTCPSILESSLPNECYGRFSVFACDPSAILAVPAGGGPAEIDRLLGAMTSDGPGGGLGGPLPFGAGWIGYLGYEAGMLMEGLSSRHRRNKAWPLARFARYDAAAVYDHQRDQWSAVAGDASGRQPPPARRCAEDRVAEVFARLEAARNLDLSDPTAVPCPATLRAGLSRSTYFDRVRAAQDYIERGHIYQMNLTQRFTARCAMSPIDLYRRLRRASPSSHAAYLAWDDQAVLSSSPELFLDLRAGRVVTRPIKGTRPRGGDAESDIRLRRELAQSAKDEAELVMIVDLLRNDLGKVCKFGSVRVTEPAAIEALPTVFHRVATIEGCLRADVTAADLIRATFPGGSITGCPKRRAMQIIDELEPAPRGVYCGAIGIIGFDGSMALNIAIRTMMKYGDTVHLHAGGAITSDSDPQSEHNEILAKARGMMAALGAEAPVDE